MSDKSKNQRKLKRAKSGKTNSTQKVQPLSVPQRKIVELTEVLNRIYSKQDLSTTCLRQCSCCRVACPQMKYCEASNIIDHIWANWSKEDKKEVLITAVKYFFSDSLIKPCPLLDDKSCRVYDKRPLNCRLYGLWPNREWEARVKLFSESTGLPREQLPLNTQCQFVERKAQKCSACGGYGGVNPLNDGNPDHLQMCTECDGNGKVVPPPLTIDQINELFVDLDKADKILHVSDVKISTAWNYRTFHDWVLLKFWGESALAKWSQLVLTTTPEQREGIVAAFEEQADKMSV